MMEAASFFPLKLFEHHVVRLEDLFELSNNFDVPIHWTVRETHFYYCEAPAKLRNL